ADANIPDGITAEVSVPLAPVPATRLPRSALTFSSGGNLGVRTVDADGTVGFLPIFVVEDEQGFMWVGGIADGSRVIVQGQDFVREGQKVEAVSAVELSATAQKLGVRPRMAKVPFDRLRPQTAPASRGD